MDLSQDGFTVAYGGAETLAPPNVVLRGARASITVGVTPAHPTTAVDIVYRVDDGLPQTVCAWELRTDPVANIQYFRAQFPKFDRGHRVDYCPVARCAGGVQVPAPGREHELTATFALADAPRAQATAAPKSRARPRFRTDLTPIASGQFELLPPFVFGETPEGFLAAFYVRGGTLLGDPLTGAIGADSVVEVRMRPGGVGLAEMHLTALTSREQVVSLTLVGKIDFGADGHRRFVCEDSLTGLFEMMATVEAGVRDLEWLQRASVLAVGSFDLNRRTVTFDLLRAKTVALP